MLCLINKLIGLLVWMCVVSLPCCPQGPSERAQFHSRTWKIAHAYSHCILIRSCARTKYTPCYIHINTLTCTQTWLLHLLTQPRSHSIQSLLTHESSQDCLRFQSVLWANSNHIEGNRILLFAYCTNSHPKAQSKNLKQGNTKKKAFKKKLFWNF